MKNANELINYCKCHKKVFCYGAGNYGKKTRIFLKENGIDISRFVVTSADSVDSLLEIPVYPLDESTDDEAGFIIGAGKEYHDEIISNLKKRGMDDYYSISEDLIQSMESEIQYSYEYPVRKFVNVLLYHKINPIIDNVRHLSVSPGHFEEHILFLKNNYNILRFEDEWAGVKEKSIVITFDDGFADFLKYALPLIEKHKVPVTLFVSTGYIDTTRELWTDELEQILQDSPNSDFSFLGEYFRLRKGGDNSEIFHKLRTQLKTMIPEKRDANLRELAQILNATIFPREENRFLTTKELKQVALSPYVTIGGHTVTHNMLSSEPESMQRNEIAECKKFLEEATGHKIVVFSYPYGQREDYTDTTVRLTKECGFKKVAAAFSGLSESLPVFGNISRNAVSDCDVHQFARELRKSWTLYGE